MASDLRAGRESTRRAKRVSTLTATMSEKRHGRLPRAALSCVKSVERSRHVPPLDPIPEFDLYAELNVAPFADADAIERAWRVGVRSVHPDRARTGDERAATTRTARLNIAREWLMDPAKRARYDLLRRPGPTVDIPTVDPLGSWPVRSRPRPSSRARFLMQGLPAFVSIGLVAFLVGLGTENVIAMMAFGLALFLLYSVTWVLIGVSYRGRDS